MNILLSFLKLRGHSVEEACEITPPQQYVYLRRVFSFATKCDKLVLCLRDLF